MAISAEAAASMVETRAVMADKGVGTSKEVERRVPTDLTGVRILVIMPSMTVQGMERSNLQIMKMMRERGADVLFVTERKYGHVVQREVEWMGCSWTAVSAEKTVHLTKRPREMASVLLAWPRAAWGIDRIYRQYKPTHIYATNLGYLLFGLPTLWRTKRIVVFRLPNPPADNFRGLKPHLSNWIWRFCVAGRCSVIVCNSRYTLCQLKKLHVNTENVRVIYNCVPERVGLEASDAPKLDANRFNVIFVGQVVPVKGVRELFEVALRIVREREDVDFYFTGDHEWKNPFAKGLIDAVKEKNLQSRIHFTGWIEDVLGLLSQCDLHVCPSTSIMESFPNVVLEAKSQGVPSVVSPSAGLAEAIRHRVDGYVCRDKSAQALYKGIRYFLDEPLALRAAGQAAKDSLERFSRERIGEEWAQVFRNIGAVGRQV